MAEKTASGAESRKDETPYKASPAVIARRLKAVQDAGNLTTKMQRGFDRLTASITNQ